MSYVIDNLIFIKKRIEWKYTFFTLDSSQYIFEQKLCTNFFQPNTKVLNGWSLRTPTTAAELR